MKLVQHVRSNTLYGGDVVEELCAEHTQNLQMIIEQNAANGTYFGYRFEPQGDWHRGKCKYENEHNLV